MKMKQKEEVQVKYPGSRQAMDGNSAVILCERESSDAAGAYPITPSTQMGEFWAEEVSNGHINISERPLIFIEPESEHAAAAVTAGLSMTGLRATNFSSAQGVAFMHESLYAAAGKRLTYVLNIGCRAITKASLNVHAGHDDYHCVDDTGFFQMMANDAQGAADLNLIAHRVAELALTPGIIAQDGFLTTHLIESLQVPERELIAEYLGRPEDLIECPTPAQKMLFGETRRRIPLTWDVDNPVTSGSVQNQDAYMQTVAAQRPFFYRHIPALMERAMEEYYQLTGRKYGRIHTYQTDDADYLIVGQGSMVVQAEAVADYLRKSRKLRVGVVGITSFRPFPGDRLGQVLKGRKGVAVLERTDQPLAEDLPLMRELRATLSKCIENQFAANGQLPWPNYAVYAKNGDIPVLYSGAFGLGSRDLQPEGLIAAVENMLDDGPKKKFFYLSIDFLHDGPESPKQELYQQELLEAYPDIGDLALRGSENPNLMPEGSITVRMHSVGGWGAVTTGKNLAMTLFDLLDYDIKANPKYGSEKKGQPTTYYLSAAPERIKISCEYHFVDAVLAPDPNVFEHSNALFGLKKGGTFVVQSSLDTPEAVWNSFSYSTRKFVVENDVRIFYVDGFGIAKSEASNADLQFRMQGIAFQGAFFKASPLMEAANLDEKSLFRAIEDQLESKFGSKGRRVVEDNLRVVRRGFDECTEILDKPLGEVNALTKKHKSTLPITLKRMPQNPDRLTDIHRFWESTGNFYVSGHGSDNLADPFMSLSLIPAATGIYRDMTQIRFEYPDWIPENCTACGDCYTACPDSAIPGLVNSIPEVFNTVIQRIEGSGRPTRHLRRAVRTLEKKLRSGIEADGESANVQLLIDQAIVETIVESELEAEALERLNTELEWFKESIGSFKFASTKPYFTAKEKRGKGSGGLFSITVNPYTCKGCMECVEVCDDAALVAVKQTPESVERLREEWNFWLDLPTTSPDYIRVDDLDEAIGALDTILLDKRNFGSLICGDGACLGCGEKTAIHLFTATVTALMQSRVKVHLAKIEDLIQRFEKHIRLKLAESMDLSDTGTITAVVDRHRDVDLTLSRLSAGLDEDRDSNPLDADWLKWATDLLARLKELKSRYVSGPNGNGRAEMGIVNATGCTSVWGSTFPYSPYPFPWTSHLFQDSPSMAMGLFEGHMQKMADGFRAVRMAELELKGNFNRETHGEFFKYFSWKDFSDEEFKLCPPVVSVGGDGAMYDIGFQNLSRAMMSGLPIKVLVLDTQVYSNTGGQSCTSGFVAQVADMAPYGTAIRGKQEIRKEISLIGMAHRTSYVMQSSVANVNHLLESYIEGLNSRRPALFNVYTTCQPEHGVGDEATMRQTKLALDSRAYPMFRFNPDRGTTLAECSDIDGNPAIEEDWVTYTLRYEEEGQQKSLEVPLTFADFAVTEGRFRKHFKTAPRESWDDDKMVPVVEFLDLDADEREGKFPYVWMVDGKNRLNRVLVSREIIESSEERRDFWRQLKGLVGADQTVDLNQVANDARIDMAQKLTHSLLAMATGNAANGNGFGETLAGLPANGNGALRFENGANGSGVADTDYEAVWVETPECTACDECIELAPKVFQYNDKKQVEVINPRGSSYKDLVKAAEKCTAVCIHPGTPWNPSEADEKLLKRASKFA
ncbi:2-oxoacid:acceptor oxidoreductase family protein [Thiohalomonas denitrificans]|uniref:2-oxoacid:acceptor oxidoreductase family protein n=1 Tax=Thiohalomonas denitrificans TaxID=415747 RepID=UPI0026F1455C|nr:2-oxoacid:acceptor oxidoreductase family protein [Thiohalomonas denitrificans]